MAFMNPIALIGAIIGLVGIVFKLNVFAAIGVLLFFLGIFIGLSTISIPYPLIIIIILIVILLIGGRKK